MAYGDPTGVNKILVEKYGYEWVNGKAWKPGTAPEPEIIPEEEAVAATPPEPSQPAETPIEEPTPSEPVSLEERIEQLEQANARIAELEGQQSDASSDVSDDDDTAVVPEETPTPDPQQPAEADEVEAVQPETPEVTAPEPEPTPQPSYPEPTGVNKILVEKYGYEWVNGKAWKPGTAPEGEGDAEPSSQIVVGLTDENSSNSKVTDKTYLAYSTQDERTAPASVYQGDLRPERIDRSDWGVVIHWNHRLKVWTGVRLGCSQGTVKQS